MERNATLWHHTNANTSYSLISIEEFETRHSGQELTGYRPSCYNCRNLGESRGFCLSPERGAEGLENPVFSEITSETEENEEFPSCNFHEFA